MRPFTDYIREYAGVGIFFLILIIYVGLIAPPRSFPKNRIITIEEGTGLKELSEKLYKEDVIKSPTLFRIAAITQGGERVMRAGDYNFSHKENVFTVAWRMVHGAFDLESIKVTIPEGFSVKKISNLFDERFLHFDHAYFERTAEEGYLFPDTYFFQVSATASSTIKLLHDNFLKKIDPLEAEIKKSGKTLDEIITMASIIENETQTQVDREMVSDILWKRLKLGLPLQVDAAFIYINGKGTADLTMDDLKIDSPYNTYLYAGLPPTPISNPGLNSIKAALHPTTTPYLYFLTSKDGKMYYAKTFEEHVINKQKYLNGS